MAAIDFPNSPTLNQEFTANGRTWIWNGTVWANKTSNTSVSRYNVSDTAPTSPANGDVWFNSTNARTYVYYDSFWVESNPALDGKSGITAVASPLTNTGTDTAAVLGLNYNALQYGQNLLINGGFEVWQRGTSHTITTSASYTADRWYASGSGGSTSCTISKQTSGSPLGIGSHARIAYNTNSAFLNIFSAFESAEVARMAGRTVTISFRARRNASFTGGINFTISTGTVADSLVSGTWTEIASASISNANLPTGTTSADWYTQSATVTIPAGTIALRMRVGEDTFQPSGAYIEFTGLKVEFGSTATPFSRAGGTIQGELAVCQRYYVRFGGTSNYQVYATGYATSSTAASYFFQYPVTMRTSAIALEYSNVAPTTNTGGGGTVFSALSASWSAPNGIWIGATGSSGLTTGQGTFLTAAGTTSSYLGVSAELQ